MYYILVEQKDKHLQICHMVSKYSSCACTSLQMKYRSLHIVQSTSESIVQIQSKPLADKNN